jgi:hypothetical protein
MADIAGCKVLTPTPGSGVPVTIDPTVATHIATWTAAQATTISVSGTPPDGQRLVLIIANDGVLPRVLTLGTGLLGNGIATGVVSKNSVISFVAYSGTFYETGRTIGI